MSKQLQQARSANTKAYVSSELVQPPRINTAYDPNQNVI